MREALAKASADVNFDNDNDDEVDMVHVIYANYSEAAGKQADAIWPHRGSLSGVFYGTISGVGGDTRRRRRGTAAGYGDCEAKKAKKQRNHLEFSFECLIFADKK